MNMKKTILVLVIKLLLWIHSFSYRVVGFLSQKVEEERIHPKHRIMNYHKFFIDNIDENGVVLDIGCGNGALSYDIAKKAKKVVGIDTTFIYNRSQYEKDKGVERKRLYI